MEPIVVVDDTPAEAHRRNPRQRLAGDAILGPHVVRAPDHVEPLNVVVDQVVRDFGFAAGEVGGNPVEHFDG